VYGTAEAVPLREHGTWIFAQAGFCVSLVHRLVLYRCTVLIFAQAGSFVSLVHRLVLRR
jgi:hypothetical protein